jgi:hypothetical protein
MKALENPERQLDETQEIMMERRILVVPAVGKELIHSLENAVRDELVRGPTDIAGEAPPDPHGTQDSGREQEKMKSR